jgi:hypothetical protein
MEKTDDKVSLHICTGRISKEEMFYGIDISTFKFVNASYPEDEYKEKHYTLEGTIGELMEITDVAYKLKEMSGNRISWALMLTDNGVTMLISTNGTHNK